MSANEDVALMNQSMLLQILQKLHNGIFPVMIIEKFHYPSLPDASDTGGARFQL